MSHTTKGLDTACSVAHTVFAMKTYLVYELRHPEHGSYIGYTSMGLANRFSRHKSQALRSKSKHPLYQAMCQNQNGWRMNLVADNLTDKQAKTLEAELISKRKPELNVKLGDGKLHPSYVWGGTKNRGKKISPQLRKWFSDFHSTRPRKRTYDRKKMIAMKNKGMNARQIANAMGCDYALAYRVINNIYKH